MAEEVPDARPLHFDLGLIVSTPGALEALKGCGADVLHYLRLHARGEWGELDDVDKAANDAALQTGARLMSAYTLPDGTRLWIITDAEIDDNHHRQATTFLLPEEY